MSDSAGGPANEAASQAQPPSPPVPPRLRGGDSIPKAAVLAVLVPLPHDRNGEEALETPRPSSNHSGRAASTPLASQFVRDGLHRDDERQDDVSQANASLLPALAVDGSCENDIRSPDTQSEWDSNPADASFGGSTSTELTLPCSPARALDSTLGDRSSVGFLVSKAEQNVGDGGASMEGRAMEDEFENSVLVDDQKSLLLPPSDPTSGDLQIHRDGFMGSGSANIRPHPGPKAASAVISDNGDQEFKYENLHGDCTSRDVATQSPHNLENVAELELPTKDDKGRNKTLMDRLFDATIHSDIINPRFGPGFIPKGHLEKIVNEESIRRELETCSWPRHQRLPTSDEIDRFVKAVCEETKVDVWQLRHGKEMKLSKIKSFRKIFALLAQVEMSPSIGDFISENVSDLDLPLELVGKGASIELRRRDREGKASSTSLRCLAHWSVFKTSAFFDFQWRMLAPYFTKGRYDEPPLFTLRREDVLPFSDKPFTCEGGDIAIAAKPPPGNPNREGGFSEVRMVYIHPNNHNFHDAKLKNRGFAVKQLADGNYATYRKEVDILKKFMGEHSHPHVVCLLASYQQFGQYNLIFHRAEGNLFEFWHTINPTPELNYATVLWIAEQCAGITQGLLRLHRHESIPATSAAHDGEEAVDPEPRSGHNRRVEIAEPPRAEEGGEAKKPKKPKEREPKFGRHGDLKPENILCYQIISGTKDPPVYCLKICDFGTAVLNSRHSKSKLVSRLAVTDTYRPPEAEVNRPKIGQEYDIWSLGCVLLEFVAWALGGAALRKEFEDDRYYDDPFLARKTDSFYEIVRINGTNDPGITVNPAVVKLFDDLHCHHMCTDFFHDLLVLISNDMLVIKPKDRIGCAKLGERLEALHQKCVDSMDYATVGKPWRHDPIRTSRWIEMSLEIMNERARKAIQKRLDELRVHDGPVR